MTRFLGLLVAVLLAAPALAQTPKGKEPTPTLDSLSGPTRAAVIKRAKNLYRSPAGMIIDFNNYETLLDVYERNLILQESGVKDTMGNRRVTSSRYVINRSDEANAWRFGYDKHDGFLDALPFAQIYYKGEELPTLYKTLFSIIHPAGGQGIGNGDSRVAESRAIWLGYFVEQPPNKKLGKPSWAIETTSVKGVYRFKLSWMDANGGRGASDEYYCEIAESEIRRGELKGKEYLLYPSAKVTTAKTGTKEKPIEYLALSDLRTETIGGQSRQIYRLIPAAELRLSAEEAAKALVAEEFVLVDWAWKKTGSGGGGIGSGGEYVWSSKSVDVKTKANPKP